VGASAELRDVFEKYRALKGAAHAATLEVGATLARALEISNQGALATLMWGDLMTAGRNSPTFLRVCSLYLEFLLRRGRLDGAERVARELRRRGVTVRRCSRAFEGCGRRIKVPK
jgi:hypothetical protein